MKLLFLLIIPLLNAKNFTLLTSFYDESNAIRKEEYFTALRINHENSLINQIIVFFEGDLNYLSEFNLHNKIKIIPFRGRPTYSFLFDFANLYLKNSKVIIANADISFDETLKLVTNDYLNNCLISLSRYELYHGLQTLVGPDFLLNEIRFSNCADSWIFKTPFSPLKSHDHKIGSIGCETFLFEILKNGYTIKNPSLDIRSYHHHTSYYRPSPLYGDHDPMQLFISQTKINSSTLIYVGDSYKPSKIQLIATFE